MATPTEKQNIWFRGQAGNEAPLHEYLPIAAGQGVFMPGAPFYMSTSGTLKLADNSDGSDDAWHYIARAGVTSALDSGTRIHVDKITAGEQWCVYVNASGTDAAATEALVGNEYGLTVSATTGQIGYVTLDTDNANATVRVVAVMGILEPEMFDLTSTPGVAVVTFLPSVIDVTRA